MMSRRFYSDLSHKFAATLRLPQTSLPKRSNYQKSVDELIPKSSQSLYQTQLSGLDDSARDVFIFHDGPPYANGELHLGHALNKILKDIIIRYNLMKGKTVFYKPGWDCHGLPIELKALETLTKKMKTDPSTKLTPIEIRAVARKHAQKTIQSQLDTFKKFAILTDFTDPYITMSHDYEIAQLNVFLKLIEKNLIKRQRKPVFWGCETHTALAEGELEYNEKHRSTAAYLKFPLTRVSPGLQQLLAAGENSTSSLPSLLIWTSTPWTIASNRAVCINKSFDYTIITNQKERLIVAASLVDDLLAMNPEYTKTGIQIPGELLLDSTYLNPISKQDGFPVLHGDHVISSAGTGLVHTAPGHGNDDYFVGLKNNLEIYSPVNDYGRYTDELAPGFDDLIGKRVLGEGTTKMLELLNQSQMVYKIDDNYIHSYPYDWRSKKPIIIRSTPQWFANVGAIKEATLNSLTTVKFVPERGVNRLSTFIKNRNEWCISRQRSWGVPIPALYSKKDENDIIMDVESVKHIIKKIDELGTDSWFEVEDNVERWLPESYKGRGAEFYKCRDTMDVWFDSGTSWTVIKKFVDEHGLKRDVLADVYLEGSDQHRGWFQSSILTKVGSDDSAQGQVMPPYKTVITHGFTLDEKGQKMSKSIGNIIAPITVIKGENGLPAVGVDGLRLWVAQSDYTSDVSIGPIILKRVGDTLKKFRISFNFMLGNLNGFEENQVVEYNDLKLIDKYVLSKLFKLSAEIDKNYREFNFSKVIKTISYHLNNDLSSTYFDITKDRLYADSEHSLSRCSTQTVLTEILKSYTSMLAPVLPLLTQEVWDHTAPWMKKGGAADSPFLNGWNKLPESYLNEELELEFSKIWRVKNELDELIQVGRKQDKVIKTSTETEIHLSVGEGSELFKVLKKHGDELADYFLVSKVRINEPAPQPGAGYCYTNTVAIDSDELLVVVSPAKQFKCPRCWKFNSAQPESLCKRCDEVV